MTRTCSLQAVHGNLLRTSIGLNGSTSPEKKDPHPNPQHADRLIHRSPSNFSPLKTIEVVGKSQPSIDYMLHEFTKLVSLVCDQYVQYLLAGTNSSVINRHR
jgi:hypothetical protein